MKLLALTALSLVLFTAGCKPDAAVRRGAVVDEPAPKTQRNPVIDKPVTGQQPPREKVQ